MTLFFRDIPPRGWNIPIGASENSIERNHLSSLIEREFTEEFVIISGPPGSEGREAFGMTDRRGEGVISEGLHRYEKFLTSQTRLRDAHDGIKLRYGSSRTRRELDTPFKVQVKDTSTQNKSCDNIIFSINPYELGIEVIRPYQVDLGNNEWLLDGEILPSPEAEWPYLVRRPILLLRTDWLSGVYHGVKPNKPKSLGELFSDEDGEAAGSLECKVLPNIPSDAFRLFGDFVFVRGKDGPNVDLRAARLKSVRERIDLLKDNSNVATPEHRKEWEALLDERNLLENWDKQYRLLFTRTMEERQISEIPEMTPLRSLCPVTWKTLELALHHGTLKSREHEKLIGLP